VSGRLVRLRTSPPSVSRLSRQCVIINFSRCYRPPRSVTEREFYILLERIILLLLVLLIIKRPIVWVPTACRLLRRASTRTSELAASKIQWKVMTTGTATKSNLVVHNDKCESAVHSENQTHPSVHPAHTIQHIPYTIYHNFTC
jgi:hypothetical protein